MARQITQKKRLLLVENLNFIERISSAIKDILGGESETNACIKHGINKKSFRNFITKNYINQSRLGHKTDMPDPEMCKDMLDMFYSWQERLLARILNETPSKCDMPSDINSTVETVLNTLNEHERDVLLMQFRDKMNNAEIAEKYNISRERIRQISEKAINKLRCKDYRNRLIFGNKIFDETQKLIEQERKNREHDLKEKCQKTLEKEQRDTEKVKQKKIIGVYIDELDISARTYNCCKRAGYRHVDDFQNVTYETLKRTRGMGKKSINELINGLKPYGIIIKKGEKHEGEL